MELKAKTDYFFPRQIWKEFSKAELQTALDELYQRNPSTDLMIKADQRLKYGDVKEVFKMTKDAGFQDVGLIAEKKQKGEGG